MPLGKLSATAGHPLSTVLSTRARCAQRCSYVAATRYVSLLLLQAPATHPATGTAL